MRIQTVSLEHSPVRHERRLRTADAAAYLGLGVSTLEKYRLTGGGPVYSKLGKVVVYDPADLDAWADARKRVSTSDAGADQPEAA